MGLQRIEVKPGDEILLVGVDDEEEDDDLEDDLDDVEDDEEDEDEESAQAALVAAAGTLSVETLQVLIEEKQRQKFEGENKE